MANPQWKAAYGGAWDEIAAAEKKAASRVKEQYFHSTDSHLASLAKTIVEYVEEIKKPDGERLTRISRCAARFAAFRTVLSGAHLSGHGDRANHRRAGVGLAGSRPEPIHSENLSNGKTSARSGHGAGEWNAPRRSGGAEATDRRRRSQPSLRPPIRRSCWRASSIRCAASSSNGCRITSQSVEQTCRRSTGQSALRRLWPQHLSRRDLYLAAFLWPGERLPDERHQSASQDHLLRPLRPREQFRFSRSVLVVVAVSGGTRPNWIYRRR